MKLCSGLLSLGISLLIFLPTLHAQSLRELIPPDPGLYAESQPLEALAKQFTDSKLYARWKEFPPVAKWERENWNAIELLSIGVSAQLGVSYPELRKNALGSEFSVAIWPAQVEGEWTARGVLLVRGLEEDFLKQLFTGINRVERRSGVLQDKTQREHLGYRYLARDLLRDGEPSQDFIAIQGRIAILTNHEPLMHQALQLYAQQQGKLPDGVEPLPTLPSEPFSVSPENCLAQVVFNPRPWGPLVREEIEKEVNPDDRRAAAAIYEFFRGVDFVNANLDLSEGITLSYYVRTAPERWNSEMQAALDWFAGQNEFPASTPANAIGLVAGHSQLGAAFEFLVRQLEGQDASDRIHALGTGLFAGEDAFTVILPNLGPDYGAYLIPSPAATNRKIPLDVVGGLSYRNQLPGTQETRSLQRTLQQSLEFIWGAVVVAQNLDGKDIARLETSENPSITTLIGFKEFPQEIHPSFSVTEEMVWVGSSPSAVAQAQEISLADSLLSSGILKRYLPEDEARPSQLAYLNLSLARDFLEDHRDRLTRTISEAKHIPLERADSGLRQLYAILKLADVVLWTQSVESNRIVSTLRIRVEE